MATKRGQPQFESELANGHTVVVLELLYDRARYDQALTAVRSKNSLDVWNTVAQALTEHGIPRLFRPITDSIPVRQVVALPLGTHEDILSCQAKPGGQDIRPTGSTS